MGAVDWSAIAKKPSSTVVDIDNAVAGLHSGDYQHLTSGEHTELTPWLANVTLGASGELTLGGYLTMTPSGRIINGGDTNTFIGFATDSISIECGGKKIAHFIESVQNQLEINPDNENVDFLVSADNNDALFHVDVNTNQVNINGGLIGGTDAITSTSDTVAASLITVNTNITTNGDSDLDNVSLANGTLGQLKIFAIVAVGNVEDSIKITPATMVGGTQITFAANPIGLGCTMVYTASGWLVTGNNGGTIA